LRLSFNIFSPHIRHTPRLSIVNSSHLNTLWLNA
jgi:hypothetical protein